jgi:hypothetical protein
VDRRPHTRKTDFRNKLEAKAETISSAKEKLE